ncbi:MAG: aminotransferase class I/II-fold pyridoxal phosphate-dependent enzyme [Promethearchaeota archaeon]|nr:MAG: aminotransferase class I/II-fold pyridoxal phosphate-dependent enzyme [Candidatus Lokiarchaeota archaeon]
MKIKLNMNEMYKSPPKSIINQVKESINNINRYTPQKEVDTLIEELSRYANVPQASIVLSSGSDLIIKEFIFLFSNNRQIIIAEPTFIVINNSAQNADSSLIKIRLNEPDFKIPLEALVNELNTPSLVVFDNPNNPTGSMIIAENDIKSILEYENVILLIDEAYFEFSNVSYVDLINNYPNLAILRTLSKSFGLAGSGIGYLIAGDLIHKKFQGLEIMLPYPSVIAGIEALRNQRYMTDYINEVETEKRRIINLVSELGFVAYPSYTNFLLIKTGIQNIVEKLANKGVLVHNVSTQFGSKYFRVTVGSKNENNYFLDALNKIVS